MSDDDDDKFYAALAGFVFHTGTLLLRAHVVARCWEWFAPEGFPPISYINALHAVLFLPVISAALPTRDHDSLPKNGYLMRGVVNMGTVLVYWGAAALLHWFVAN